MERVDFVILERMLGESLVLKVTIALALARTAAARTCRSFGSLSHALDQGLVAGDCRARKRLAHLTYAVVDLVGSDALLDQVPAKLGEHVGGRQWSIGTGLGEPQQRVTQVGGVEHARVEECREGHGASSLASWRRGRLVQPSFLASGCHLVKRLPTLAA